ncbi:transposase [Roseisolibacter agri]|uniref:transposase n=1 Tax=Roseisolibacter agri TaxID=2014610 RepID=UPI0024E163F7|nr:transposase [Roseisolibacter agri]
MTTVLRCDPLAHAANAGKTRALRAVLRAYRAGAVLVSREQWRLLFETGRINKFYRSPEEHALAAVVGAANRLQMVRGQVVGVLAGFLETRADDFARVVQRSSLPPEVRHQLHTVNRRQAWFSRGPVPMKDGTPVPAEVQRLARTIMRHVLAQHRRPTVSRINAVLDARAATLAPAASATHHPLWVTVSTMVPQQRVAIPLVPHAHFADRAGTRKATVQLNEDRDGRLTVGVITDVTAVFAESRAAYQPRREEVALDWGLRPLFGSDQGDLLGRGFLDRLRYYDRRITRLAQYRQRHKLRVRSPRYDREVQRLRGFLRETINRVLNRVVARDAPGRLIVERLHFRRPELSRRMNRLVTNAGRALVQAKLQDLEDRYGIEVVEVQAAYSSQECCDCHFVDPKNRRGATFRCGRCGVIRHADVNSPRTLRSRRSRLAGGGVGLTKAATLRALVALDLRERPVRTKQGRWGTSRDPRWHAPYYAEALRALGADGQVVAVTSSGRRIRRSACVSAP